jgi:hypothetical protein
MSTESNRKWSRIDGRMAEARQLLDMWAVNRLDNRNYVLARAMTSVRMVAAIAVAGHASARLDKDGGIRANAAVEICELIARERAP